MAMRLACLCLMVHLCRPQEATLEMLKMTAVGMMEKYDADSNGILDRFEVTNLVEENEAKQGKNADEDDDSIQEKVTGMIEMADENSDSVITTSEMKKFMIKMNDMNGRLDLLPSGIESSAHSRGRVRTGTPQITGASSDERAQPAAGRKKKKKRRRKKEQRESGSESESEKTEL